MNVKPGVRFWGGSDEVVHGQAIPHSAINKWEEELGFDNQHHVQVIGLHRTAQQGLRTQIELARRVINGGGYVQFMIWGTPEHLASVPIEWRDGNNRQVYPKYPPRDNNAWADLYVRAVSAIIKAVGAERTYFNIWQEAIRFYWRSSERTFWQLYGAVQVAMREYQQKEKVKVKFGGNQVCDIADEQIYLHPFTATPTLVWIERWYGLMQRYGWQVDYIDLHQYHTDPKAVIERIVAIEELLMDLGWDVDLIFNSISPRGEITNTQEGAQYTMELAKRILTETSINRANFEFIEDTEPHTSHGLLHYGTLEEKPRYRAAKKIINWQGVDSTIKTR